jgi:hypothetical protein
MFPPGPEFLYRVLTVASWADDGDGVAVAVVGQMAR